MEIKNNICKVNLDHMSLEEVAKANPFEVNVIICLSTQKKYDLFLNEMQGQISDGMWENSRKTSWLWAHDVMVCMGDMDKVLVRSSYAVGKKNFKWCSELNCIADRAVSESGFSDEAEMKRAWNEIAAAIANPVIDYELLSNLERAQKEAKSVLFKNAIDNTLPKIIEALSTKGKAQTPTVRSSSGSVSAEITLLPNYAANDTKNKYKAAVCIKYTYYADGRDYIDISCNKCVLNTNLDDFFSGSLDKAMEMMEIVYWFIQQGDKK